MKKKILGVMLSAVLTATMLVGCGDSVETGESAESGVNKPQGSLLEEPETKEVTVVVKATMYNSDGSVGSWTEYEYMTITPKR